MGHSTIIWVGTSKMRFGRVVLSTAEKLRYLGRGGRGTTSALGC